MVEYCSIQHQDPDNAAEVDALTGQDNLADHRRGLKVLGVEYTASPPILTLSSGEAWVMIDEYQAVSVDEPRYNTLMMMHFDRRDDIELTETGVNYVYAHSQSIPPGEAPRNSPRIEVTGSDVPPYDDSLLIAEVDLNAETYNQPSPHPDTAHDTAEVNEIILGSSVLWPDGNRTFDSPITWDSILDHTNTQYDDAVESNTTGDTKRYVRKSRYADTANYANNSGHSDTSDNLLRNGDEYDVDRILNRAQQQSDNGWTYLDYFEHGNFLQPIDWVFDAASGGEGGDGKPYDMYNITLYLENRLVARQERDNYPEGAPRNNLFKCRVNKKLSNNYFYRKIGGGSQSKVNTKHEDDWKIAIVPPNAPATFDITISAPDPVTTDSSYHYPTFSSVPAVGTNSNGTTLHGHLEENVENVNHIRLREINGGQIGWAVLRGWRKDEYLDAVRS